MKVEQPEQPTIGTLTLANHKLSNPTTSQIKKALNDLQTEQESCDAFAIYGNDDTPLVYIQTMYIGAGTFFIEYQDGSIDERFSSVDNTLTLEQVQNAFIWYANKDVQWR